MHVLFVIDPLSTLNLATETSLLLIEELARRGDRASIATLVDLYATESGAGVRSQSIRVDLGREPFYELDTAQDGPFSRFDLVLMRKDPPVDADYIAATFLLERAAAEVPVLNPPMALRNFNEKLLPLRFPDLSPATLVSNDAARLSDFAARHRRVVLKPLEDCSGRGIRLVDDGDAASIAEYVSGLDGRYVLAQEFLEGVVGGDKRILLLEGSAIGAVNRVPADRDHLANIHQGARVEATALSPRELDIVTAVRPLLVEHRIWLAGIDVIDGRLTEINITSPSAVRQINAVSGLHLERRLVDSLTKHIRRPLGTAAIRTPRVATELLTQVGDARTVRA